ncbi:MAG: hypothetical protein WAL52_17940 [Candidatus Sulfotelmatobacter sp.]
MAEWSRTTPWRQGHLLSDEALSALNVKSVQSPERTVVVVISHDCDIAATPAKEPKVEVISGRLIDKPSGDFVHAKNARTLHLRFVRDDKEQWVELSAAEKLAIAKADLADFAPRSDLGLDQVGRSTLQRWLAARYRRSAFPEAFEKRLKENGFQDKLVGILKPYGEHILAIFFDVDDGKEEMRLDPADTYALTMYLLYTTELDPGKAQTAAQEAREKVETAFRQKFFEPTRRWSHIELCECAAISDEVLTYRQSTLFKEWRLEYLSLREDPPQPMLNR